MKTWVVLFALASGLTVVSAESWKDLPNFKAPDQQIDGASLDRIKTWRCQEQAFEGQGLTGKSTKDKKFGNVLGDIEALTKPLTNQPDGKWGKPVGCNHGIGVYWRNTGKEPKTVFGSQLAYFADIVAHQTSDGPGQQDDGEAGFIGPSCRVGNDVHGGSLGVLVLKDDWEVNVGSC